jgi:hypothetical protein
VPIARLPRLVHLAHRYAALGGDPGTWLAVPLSLRSLDLRLCVAHAPVVRCFGAIDRLHTLALPHFASSWSATNLRDALAEHRTLTRLDLSAARLTLPPEHLLALSERCLPPALAALVIADDCTVERGWAARLLARGVALECAPSPYRVVVPPVALRD